MRLISAVVPEFRRLIPSGNGVVTITFLGMFLGLEVIGRWASSDLHDFLAAMVLGSGIAMISSRHRRSPIPWVTWFLAAMEWVATRLSAVRSDHGIDLRGTPPYPRKLPPAAWLLLGFAFAWAIAAALAWVIFPGGWREFGTRYFSYVLYLLVLSSVWAGLLMCAFAGVWLPVMLLDRRLRHKRWVEFTSLGAYATYVGLIAYFVPTIVVLTLCLGVTIAAAVFMLRASTEEPAILWRTGVGKPIYSVPLRRILAGSLGLFAFFVFDLILTACGGHLLTVPEPTDSMPVTAFIGTTAGWFAAALVPIGIFRLIRVHRGDPACRTPATVHVQASGEKTKGSRRFLEMKQAVSLITAWGWSAKTGEDQADRLDVHVELVPPDRSQATEFDPRWPLKVSLADLEAGAVKDRLARRDEIQLRRHACRGMAVIFKKAIVERKVRGGGYWFAPHWWFTNNMEREEPHRGRGDKPPPPHPVGPQFHRVFGPRVRQHLHQILRAVQVDMIFIEDGIGHRTVEKVLRAIFTVFDKHAGTRRVEDHHFRDIHKVRVMVHEYAPGNPFQTSKYLEPQFDDLSRARVMHIFKENGGEEAVTEAPFDFSWEPSPALGIE